MTNLTEGHRTRPRDIERAPKPESGRLLREALVRGEFERGEASRICGLPERSACRVSVT